MYHRTVVCTCFPQVDRLELQRIALQRPVLPGQICSPQHAAVCSVSGAPDVKDSDPALDRVDFVEEEVALGVFRSPAAVSGRCREEVSTLLVIALARLAELDSG